MDDGEVDSHSPGGSLLDLQSEPYSHFLDEFSVIQNDWDTLIGTQICSHKHICNPTTGPDNKHTHTCEHTHTHTIGSGDDEKLTKKRRPAGNKEAVRKYREKQKAVKVNLEVRNAELEKENQRIPELQKENSRLRRKLQEQGPRQDAVDHLLAENKRLKSLLSCLRRAIDSELEALKDVSYQNLRCTPKTVDRVGGTFLPAGGRCTAPPPCFPARATANHREMSDDLEHMDGSLGWHRECEVVKKMRTCHSPQEELDDAGADQSTRTGSEVGTPCSNAGTSSSKSKERPLVCPARTAAAAASRRRSIKTGHTLATPASPLYQQQLTGGIPCPVAAPPLPCFSCGASGADLNHHLLPDVGDDWLDDCDFIDGVCQAHLVHARPNSSFEGRQETEHDSTAPPPAVTQLPITSISDSMS